MPAPTLSYHGTVTEDGQLKLPTTRLRAEVAQSFSGKAVEVVIKVKRKTRSSRQNRYYHGIVIPSVMLGLIDLGWDFQIGNAKHLEEVHNFLKNKFLDNGREGPDSNGVQIVFPPSTTYCTTTDMMDYIDRIARWAGEDLMITIPGPNEQAELIFTD